MENIAVVGIANLFPGSNAPDAFWQQLLNQQDNRSKATHQQMGADVEKYTGAKGDVDKFYCVHGGYIRDFSFDGAAFCQADNGLSKDYLSQLDDLHQWSLFVAKEALSDAGYWGSAQLDRCGVILGNLSFPTKSSNQLFLPMYHQVVEDTLQQVLVNDVKVNHFSSRDLKKQPVHSDNALVAGYPSALLAKAAGLGGAHFSLDAACASSCYSLKLACDYLHTGKADMMLAGAVSAADPMFVNMGFSIFQAYPENNVHAPFDQKSQGLFAGEGAGMMVLKRHSDAVKDGDTIHAIIKGGGLSNDGKGEFVLSPNTKGQVLVYERAYEDAQVSPTDVDYIECHATGTPKGDNVELGSMEQFFARYDIAEQDKPLLGSVKSNLGHLLTAAGMPGMTKAIWALKEKQIPATINVNSPLSSKQGYFSGKQIPTKTTPWPSKNITAGKPKTAGVSVFGFGGANAHIVLQEASQVLNDKFIPAKQAEPLAIVGMDAHFGQAKNLQEFSNLVTGDKTAFTSLPKKRWKGMEQNKQVMQRLGLELAPIGAYIDSFDLDFLRFKVPPNEQDCLIPQQLMMMKVADNAAKDAKLIPGSNVAVLVAMGLELELHQYRGRVNLTTQIEESLKQQGIDLTSEQLATLTGIAKDGVSSAAQLNQYTSFIGNIMASRISALWDFSGPAITVSAEENSVYRCTELAQNLFQTSDVEAVIIAAVDLAGSIENISLRQQFGPVSNQTATVKYAYSKGEDNRDKILKDNELLSEATWQVGEGAAAFVVKPQSKVKPQSASDNQQEANQVYATIESVSFVNENNATAIKKAAEQAQQQANISSRDINFVEAHASGFALENSAERVSLPALYFNKPISSIKQKIGHTYNASGAASIINVALSLQSLKANQADTSISEKSYAAINGLGKDGSCAHLILSCHDSRAVGLSQPVNSAMSEQATNKQLIKTITLGGDAISDIMMSAANNSENAELVNTIRDTINSTIQNTVKGSKQSVKKGTAQGYSQVNTQPQTAKVPDMKSVAKTAVKASVKASVKATVNESAHVTLTVNDNSIQGDVMTIETSVAHASTAHLAFLKNRQLAQQHIAKVLQQQALQQQTQQQLMNGGAQPSHINAHSLQAKPSQAKPSPVALEASPLETAAIATAVSPANAGKFEIKGPAGYRYPPLVLKERFNQPNNIIWDTDDLVEFAEGDIAKVFGEEYRIIDSYSRRVRLPTTDYLLVSRVTELDAQVNEYRKSYMCTEYDIPVDAPFLIDGQIPWSVSVESGQCDLLLISFIGIDFQAKGERVYRLLDCELTFLEEMAFGGETLRYEIHIDSYAKNGEQLLFFFHYDCYVGDKKVLIMRNGCAGFFTDEELKDGKGVIHNDNDKKQFSQAVKSSFTPLLNRPRDQYNYQDMMKLVNGDVAGCFGSAYDQQGRNPSLKFSSKKFLMIERITKINAQGGHWGLGVLEGQKDLHPDHWYFPCHFKDDQVMAGSLMSEGCGQMAMFFMLSLGMHSSMNNARFQPMPGEAQTVRCRGQVIPQHNTLTYRMEVTEMGMLPQPYLKANIDIILDGKVVVDFKNLSMMIVEQDEHSPYPVSLPDNVVLTHEASQSQYQLQAEQLAAKSTGDTVFDERGIDPFKRAEQPLMRVVSDNGAPKNKGVTPIQHFEAPAVAGQNRVPDQVPFTPWHLFEFATGDIANCFGSDFSIYSNKNSANQGKNRIPPRTPCGDLQVVTQVVEVKGKRLDFQNPASCISEYYVPADAWYFNKNTVNNWMPYSIIMEIALQPNGFISGYMGTTLKYPDKDLFFRNLDGSGELLKQVDLRGKTIINKSELLSTTMAGGMIVQSFTFALYVKAEGSQNQDELFYQGTAVFGYFGEAALTNQLGIDNGKITHAWFVDNNTPISQIERIDLTNKALSYYQAPSTKPHYKLAGDQLNFIDTVSIVEGGGSHHIAYVFGERTVDASDWFFRYHFHQDPVMPGSLGVEAIIELLQVYALKNELGKAFINPRFIAPTTTVKWKYRGQITPLNKQMSLDVHITDIIKTDSEIRLVGDANLSKDGLRIYEVKDIVLSIVEA